MSRQLAELESILQQMVAEHKRLLSYLAVQQAAMQAMDVRTMNEVAKQQEASRLRILGLESRRRAATAQLAKALKIEPAPSLTRIAELHPQRSEALLRLRAELRDTMEALRAKAHVAGRLAGAVLGHLNTAVRLLVGAVEKVGLYTRDGAPRVVNRIGVMEAIG